jgi:subtilisin-like proprotein convertase family protein
VTPVGSQDAFTFQTSMPNCAPVSSYNVAVFIMTSAPPPAPPLPPKQMLDVNVQPVVMPPNMTEVLLGVPSLVRLRATMAIPDAALDVLPIAVAENWTVVYVSVSVINLRHDTAGDVRLSLRSPSKPDPVFLLNNNCGFSNFVSNDEPVTPLSAGGTFTFSDAAPAPVSAVCGYPVPAGAYKPVSPDAGSADPGTLGLLAGAPASGVWFFTFEDRTSGGVGYFDELRLTLTGAGPGESVTYTIPETSAVTQLPSIGTLYLDAAGSASMDATAPGAPVVPGVWNPGVNYWYTSGPTARAGDADDFPYKAIVAGREQNWTVQQVITLFGAPPPAPPPAAPVASPPPDAPPAPYPPAPTPPAPPTPRPANGPPAPPAAPARPAPPAAAPCVAGTGIQPVQLDPSSPAYAARASVTAVLGAPPTKIWLWGPFAIPDGGADAITWRVAEGFTVSGVSLRLDGLRHAYASDLTLTLTNPAGVVTYLVNIACGTSRVGSSDVRVTSGSVGEDFLFADAAAGDAANPTIAGSCADPLHGGVYAPGTSSPGDASAGSMASLAGGLATGAWQLRFADVAVKDAGFFDWASLTLTGTRGESVVYDMPLRYSLATLPSGTLALPGGAPAAVGPVYTGNYLMYTPNVNATDASGDSFAYSVLFGCPPATAATQAIVVSVPAPPSPSAARIRTLRDDAVQPAVLTHSAAYTNYVALHTTSPVDAACVLVLPQGVDDDIPMNVPDSFIVAGVSLTLPDICHSSSQSLTVSLRAPPNADGSVDEVFLMNGNCPGFFLGVPNELTDGCLGEPLTFMDSAVATFEGVCTGGALGGPPDRTMPLPGGFFKPTIETARGSVEAGSMALLAGRGATGTWVLRVINAEGGLANFSCPLLLLTDTDGAVHTYVPSVSVQILLEPSGGLLYAQSELQRVAALTGGAPSGAPSRRLLQATLNAPPAPSAVPNAVGSGDLLDELRLFYRPHESTTADDVDVYTYRFVYGGRATLRNITQGALTQPCVCRHAHR